VVIVTEFSYLTGSRRFVINSNNNYNIHAKDSIGTRGGTQE